MNNIYTAEDTIGIFSEKIDDLYKEIEKMKKTFVIKTNFTFEYFYDDKLHRDNAPAVRVFNDCKINISDIHNWTFYVGDKLWFKNGKCHREGGPAVEWSNGDGAWFVDGKLHKLDGPAIERKDGSKEWWIEGKQYSEAEFNNFVVNTKLESDNAKLKEEIEELKNKYLVLKKKIEENDAYINHICDIFPVEHIAEDMGRLESGDNVKSW